MSDTYPTPVDPFPPALRRLAALTPLDDEALRAMTTAIDARIQAPPRRELMTEGQPIGRPLLLVEGWAVRARLLPDGRRQLVGFLLPGETIGLSGYENARATCTVSALTAVATCRVPQDVSSPALHRVLAIGRMLDEAYLIAQVTRLGRLNAGERILDLVLELHERLSLAGLADADGYEVPLTQDMLADTLGLTSVHVNRMLQQLRRSGDLEWSGQRVRIPDLERARGVAGRTGPTAVA